MKTLSVRIPRDAFRKIEKIAEMTGESVTQVAAFFLEMRCKQPVKRKVKKHEND